MSPTPYDGSPPYQSQTFPTPPSTAGFSSHMPMQDMNNSSATLEQNTMDQSQGDTPMTDAPDYRRSDHDRQPSPRPKSPSVAMPLLCQKPYPISRPHPSQDLIQLYNLGNIASSVARKDPLTGEKINKLRKSYEGKVKNLALPGKNKPTDRPGELLGFMEWPDEAWVDQRVYGKELEKAESAPIMAKLGRALQFNPGRLPNDDHDKWKSLLNYEETATTKGTPSLAPTKNPAQQAMLKSQSSSLRASAPASPRSSHGVRPDRPNKKRRYDESSYHGYNDAYDDGYSTGGMDDKRDSATKKRRKDFSPGFEGSSSTFNSNSGMLGLGVKSS